MGVSEFNSAIRKRPILTPGDLRWVMAGMLAESPWDSGLDESPHVRMDVEVTDTKATVTTKLFTHITVVVYELDGRDLLNVAQAIRRRYETAITTVNVVRNTIGDINFPDNENDPAFQTFLPLDMEGCNMTVGPCKYKVGDGMTFYGKVRLKDVKKRLANGTPGNKKALVVNFYWRKNKFDHRTEISVCETVRARGCPEPFIGAIVEWLKKNQLDLIKRLTKRPVNKTGIGEYDPVTVRVCKALDDGRGNPLRCKNVTQKEMADPDFMPSLFIEVGQNRKKRFLQTPDERLYWLRDSIGTAIFEPDAKNTIQVTNKVDEEDEFLKVKVEQYLKTHGL